MTVKEKKGCRKEWKDYKNINRQGRGGRGIRETLKELTPKNDIKYK